VNNKSRKLKYIREKNHLRLGGILIDYIKASLEYFNDEILKKEAAFLKEKYESKYKIPLNVNMYGKFGYLNNEDFIGDIVTQKFSISAI